MTITIVGIDEADLRKRARGDGYQGIARALNKRHQGDIVDTCAQAVGRSVESARIRTVSSDRQGRHASRDSRDHARMHGFDCC